MIFAPFRAASAGSTIRPVFDPFVALLCFCLAFAPFGCQIQQAPLNQPIDDEPPTSGLFIDENLAAPVIVAGKNEAGDALFVHGTRNSSGGLADVESILVRTAAGEESFVAFESGRPVHAQGPDGSYVNIEYTQVAPTMLTANVTLFDAAAAQTSAYTVELDLLRAVSQIADEVAQRTGQRIQLVDVSSVATAKSAARADTRITIFSPLLTLLVLPLLAVVTLMTLVLGQLLTILYALVIVTIQAALLVALAPLFLIGALLGDTVVSIRLLSLADVFGALPAPPLIILTRAGYSELGGRGQFGAPARCTAFATNSSIPTMVALRASLNT